MGRDNSYSCNEKYDPHAEKPSPAELFGFGQQVRKEHGCYSCEKESYAQVLCLKEIL
jgi:hypothetical protein